MRLCVFVSCVRMCSCHTFVCVRVMPSSCNDTTASHFVARSFLPLEGCHLRIKCWSGVGVPYCSGVTVLLECMEHSVYENLYVKHDLVWFVWKTLQFGRLEALLLDCSSCSEAIQMWGWESVFYCAHLIYHSRVGCRLYLLRNRFVFPLSSPSAVN